MPSPTPSDPSALADELAGIFAGELEEQLRAAAAVLPLASATSGARHRRELARIFHTIKGGAGVAGRTDLATAAASLERFFADPATRGAPGQEALEILFAAAGLAALGAAASAPVPDQARHTRAILLAVGAHRVALPLRTVERAVVIDARAVLVVDGRSVVEVGGASYQLVPLHAWLGEALPAHRAAALLLRGATGATVALLADRISAPCSVWLTPLGSRLSTHPLLSAAALASDGAARLVLDADRLLALGGEPAALRDRADVADASGAQRPRSTVLVVDDSRTVRNAIADVLRGAGIGFDLASDGREALSKLGSGHFALVLTDLEMPNMDGFELIEVLRRDQRWQGQPVVVCSSRPSDETPRLRELGVASYLPKPFSPAALLEHVKPFVIGAGQLPRL